MSKFQQIIKKWKESRKNTISCLRNLAVKLNSSHRRNVFSEHDSAAASAFGGLIGLSGVLLAPLSGGWSLAFAGASTLTSGGSWLNKRNANKQDEEITKELARDTKRVIDQDIEANEQRDSILQMFKFLQEKLDDMEIDDILVENEETTVTEIDINVREIKSIEHQCNLQQENGTISFTECLEFAKHFANFNAAVNRAEKVVRGTMITKTIYERTKTIQEVVSTAKSLNEITQTAKSLAEGKQAVGVTLQAIGIPTMTKGADSIKTITEVATDLDIRATGTTTTVQKIGKASKTATKVALAINAVTIPLEFYNLMVTGENLSKNFEDVQRIRDMADSLEKEMNDITKAYESFSQLHFHLCKVYEDYHNERIYEYLRLLHTKLDFDIPPRY